MIAPPTRVRRSASSRPKTAWRITSSVIACMLGISAKASSTGQRAISRSVASAINLPYAAMRSPWNGGSSSLRCRRCARPSSRRIEVGPNIGAIGDRSSPTMSLSGPAVNSVLMASGSVTKTTSLTPRSPKPIRRSVKASP